ncbi:MAG: amino acid permease [Alphaproteobacteria bacterium]|nr:amino acid permease [Alphaproteobacteria bacterium]MBU1515200.1 amino acid permease [Alphaproteobacteria bacterium]MBU2092330.1 amino acid permease [Alphaproteobacteria bacterium]MBU2152924.1 amino acid permease [Alphaproteobacteria bacterium]MBU2305755.1 amino acid permease [Alphaproteobacteria bacterium]
MSAAKASLGPLLATMLVAGSMIGSGVYLLPASLAAIGSISILAWLAAIAAALVFAAVFAWLATLRADGGLGFIGSISAGFGPRAAFVAAVLYWLQGVLGNVALALAVTGYLTTLAPVLEDMRYATACTIAVIWLFVVLNLAGPRLVAQLEGWTLLLGLAPVLAAGVLGWLYFDPAVFSASWNVSGKPPSAMLPGAVVLVLWAFLGLESACVSTAILRDPVRTAPLATMCGVLLAAVIYLSACTALTGILPAAALAASPAPFADAAGRMAGGSFAVLVAICATFKAAGTLGGWVLLTSAAGQQAVRLGAPQPPEPKGPSVANFLFNGLLLTIIALLIAEPSIARQFTVVINAAVVLMLCVYAMAGAALLKLRGAQRWAAGLLGVVAVGVVLAVMASQDVPMLALAGATVVGALVAWPLVRRRASRAAT